MKTKMSAKTAGTGTGTGTKKAEKAPAKSLPVVTNLERARFECVFPTCGGICCQNGRPAVEETERRRIASNLKKFLPHLRPEARRRIEATGFVTNRRKGGLPMLGVVGGWCVFHNEGCVLHKVGAEEGDRFQYKPWRCAAFPLDRKDADTWYVRQWGVEGEAWDLFCLDPQASPQRAGESLAGELAFVAELGKNGREAWRKPAPPK